MKTLLRLVSVCSLLILFSCQKEVDPTDFTGTGGNTKPQKLSKLIIKNGQDSIVTAFGYNANDKLVSVITFGTDSGFDIYITESYSRNSQGIITEIITKDADLVAAGIDSVITKLNYSGGRYTNRVSVIDFFGMMQFKDSLVFTYNGAGNVSAQEQFLDVGAGAGYEKLAKTEFTYTGNNITSVKSYSFEPSTGGYVEEYSETISYDSKTSPLILGNEAFALGYYSWFSANNAIKSVAVSPSDPTLNETQDISYVYNSSNKPVSGTAVVQGGPTALFTFSYQ